MTTREPVTGRRPLISPPSIAAGTGPVNWTETLKMLGHLAPHAGKATDRLADFIERKVDIGAGHAHSAPARARLLARMRFGQVTIGTTLKLRELAGKALHEALAKAPWDAVASMPTAMKPRLQVFLECHSAKRAARLAKKWGQAKGDKRHAVHFTREKLTGAPTATPTVEPTKPGEPMSVNRKSYARAVHDALDLFGSDTSHTRALQERSLGEMSGKHAATMRQKLSEAFGQLLEHATPEHLAALKDRGHSAVIDDAVQDLPLAALRRMHQRLVGPLKRDAVQLDVQRAVQARVDGVTPGKGRPHRPPTLTGAHDGKVQEGLGKLRRRVGDMPPTQWEPVKGKPGRRKRRLPSGRWHYEDVVLQKANESHQDYIARLCARVHALGAR